MHNVSIYIYNIYIYIYISKCRWLFFNDLSQRPLGVILHPFCLGGVSVSAGLAGLFLSASCLSVGGALGLSGDGRWWGLVGLYAFTAFYSISLGALVWVLVSDVFPTCHRAQAISIVCMAHFTTSATVIVLIPVMVSCCVPRAANAVLLFSVVQVADFLAKRSQPGSANVGCFVAQQ